MNDSSDFLKFFNVAKSIFGVLQIRYLGHELSVSGISLSHDKMQEILQCKSPGKGKGMASAYFVLFILLIIYTNVDVK